MQMSVIITRLTGAAVCESAARRVLRNQQRWRETEREEKELLSGDRSLIM